MVYGDSGSAVNDQNTDAYIDEMKKGTSNILVFFLSLINFVTLGCGEIKTTMV